MVNTSDEGLTWYTLFEDERTDKCSKQNFNHQVAGHVSKRLTTFLDDFVLKPRIKYDLFDNEIRFYEKMQKLRESSQLYNQYTPFYFGVYHEQSTEDDEVPSTSDDLNYSYSPYIVLNDLTSGYIQPNLIDIKMGQQTYEPTAKQDKINREILKYVYQKTIGFRITGYKVFNVITQQYDEIDKYFGRSLLPTCVDYGLAYFFYNGVVFHLTIIKNVIEQLKKILSYMEVQTQFHYYCSSILIVYDAFNNCSKSGCSSLDSSMNCDSLEVIKEVAQLSVKKSSSNVNIIEDIPESRSHLVNVENSRVTVSMIDFAHTIAPPAPTLFSSTVSDTNSNSCTEKDGTDVVGQLDTGYIHGLCELIRRLSTIVTILDCIDDNLVTDFKNNMLDFMNSVTHVTKKSPNE